MIIMRLNFPCKMNPLLGGKTFSLQTSGASAPWPQTGSSDVHIDVFIDILIANQSNILYR